MAVLCTVKLLSPPARCIYWVAKREACFHWTQWLINTPHIAPKTAPLKSLFSGNKLLRSIPQNKQSCARQFVEKTTTTKTFWPFVDCDNRSVGKLAMRHAHDISDRNLNTRIQKYAITRFLFMSVRPSVRLSLSLRVCVSISPSVSLPLSLSYCICFKGTKWFWICWKGKRYLFLKV